MTTPVQIRRVLVAVDLEESTASAVAAAGALARAFGATLSAVHAHSLEMPAYFTEAQLQTLEEEREQIHASAAAELQAFTAQHTDVAVTPIIEEGTPAQVILRLGPAFDLIVIGTRRRHGARRWWLGSVAEEVVRKATFPVLVVSAGVAVEPVVHAGASIVAAGSGSDRLEAWLAALGSTMQGDVRRTGEISHCTPERLRGADLVVVALPPPSTSAPGFDAVVQVLKECPHPVLFVPAAEALLRRS